MCQCPYFVEIRLRVGGGGSVEFWIWFAGFRVISVVLGGRCDGVKHSNMASAFGVAFQPGYASHQLVAAVYQVGYTALCET